MLAIRYAVTAPGTDALRALHFEAHRAYLRSGTIRIVQSGPLYDTDEGEAPGAALVVAEVETLDDMVRFSTNDPFVIHGVYGEIAIRRWNKTIG